MGHVGVFLSALYIPRAQKPSPIPISPRFSSLFKSSENDGSSSKHTRLRRKRSSRTPLLFRNRGRRLERYRDWVPVSAVDGRRDLSLGALFIVGVPKNSLKGNWKLFLPSFLPSFLPLSFLVSFSSSLVRRKLTSRGALSLFLRRRMKRN